MSALNKSLTLLAETVWWYAALLLALMLVLSCCEGVGDGYYGNINNVEMMNNMDDGIIPATTLLDAADDKVCDEIYVVKEGETLHTISDKCGDPFIVEENPHIHDPDDVFPGLVIKITPFKHR